MEIKEGTYYIASANNSLLSLPMLVKVIHIRTIPLLPSKRHDPGSKLVQEKWWKDNFIDIMKLKKSLSDPSGLSWEDEWDCIVSSKWCSGLLTGNSHLKTIKICSSSFSMRLATNSEINAEIYKKFNV